MGHVVRDIFSYFSDDTKTLLACRAVSSEWRDHVDLKTPLWSRFSMIRAVVTRRADVGRFIIKQVEEKNPMFSNGDTALHLMAKTEQCGGSADICRVIVDKVENKNPRNAKGMTPLHVAVSYGNLEAVQVILEAVTDKNPKDNDGHTPLHLAVRGVDVQGDLIFRKIFEHAKEKNPADYRGKTPLHWAAKYGYVQICQLIVNHIEEFPIDDLGKSPLDNAKNSKELCEVELSGSQSDGNREDAMIRIAKLDQVIEVLLQAQEGWK